MFVFYWVFNALVERLSQRWERRIKPYVFVAPAVAIVGLFLVYPVVQTVIFSFADRNSTAWVGFENYTVIFKDDRFVEALLNNLLWIIVVPTFAVAIGLLVAVMADRLKPGGEKLAKSIIFMPMAISFVGASTIWGFVYQTEFRGSEQIGLLSAITTKLGFEPQRWLALSTFSLNDLLLIIIMVWLQAGFAMVLLSAAIKGVPEETLEAARIDGAGEVSIFFRVIVPQIWPTVIVVFTTVLILVMKVFDIVNVMTNGRDGTEVVANRFYNLLFESGETGQAAAVVVILMLAVVPVMIYQVRQFRREEAAR
ncbi:MAG: sugar ABC transporter permease [Propionibacteriales bacterium]|nr:sugar ABC transporter permease [Propionibacteriales bacterium]